MSYNFQQQYAYYYDFLHKDEGGEDSAFPDSFRFGSPAFFYILSLSFLLSSSMILQ